VSTKRSRSKKRGNKRQQDPWPQARPWHERGPSDDEIAAFDDDPDGLRLTVTMSLVVRVTRPKVLDRFTREVLRARAEALDPADFAPLAYLAACQEGQDEVGSGPAGQVGYLADPAAVVAGIPGLAVEDAAMSIEPTPAEAVLRIRADLGFLEQPDDDMADEEAVDEVDGEEARPT
jgi:hypothetical protein